MPSNAELPTPSSSLHTIISVRIRVGVQCVGRGELRAVTSMEQPYALAEAEAARAACTVSRLCLRR